MISYYENGFWFHITRYAGGWGVDQHGGKWTIKGNQARHEDGVFSFSLTDKNVIWPA